MDDAITVIVGIVTTIAGFGYVLYWIARGAAQGYEEVEKRGLLDGLSTPLYELQFASVFSGTTINNSSQTIVVYEKFIVFKGFVNDRCNISSKSEDWRTIKCSTSNTDDYNLGFDYELNLGSVPKQSVMVRKYGGWDYAFQTRPYNEFVFFERAAHNVGDISYLQSANNQKFNIMPILFRDINSLNSDELVLFVEELYYQLGYDVKIKNQYGWTYIAAHPPATQKKDDKIIIWCKSVDKSGAIDADDIDAFKRSDVFGREEYGVAIIITNGYFSESAIKSSKGYNLTQYLNKVRLLLVNGAQMRCYVERFIRPAFK
jgi:hypothetical protein